ncbi:MAG: hypothetical protein JW818_19575, partial [Pirellulales bacterium]|nr:hypothetical protein [Pirellulales bacterium]
FFVRFPAGDPEVNEALWQQLDEQQFTPEQRRALWENGFRAGVLSGPMPETLSRLMELAGKPVAAGQANQMSLADAAVEPKVTRRHLQLQADTTAKIIASPPQPVMTVLMPPDASGKVSARDYYQAQPLVSVVAQLIGDGRVRLDLTPKLQHGQILQRWVGNNRSTIRSNPGQECVAFDRLGLDVPLSPGDMLILSNLPTLSGSLGHHFFTATTDDGVEEQKLLILRLSQTQHDGQFDSVDLPGP